MGVENLPLIIRIFILALLLYGFPVVTGGCFVRLMKDGCGVGGKGLPFLWVSGQMLLWALFQLICVPLVLTERDFTVLVIGFGAAMVIAAVSGAVCLSKTKRFKGNVVKKSITGQEYILWGTFAVLLLFQLVQTVRLAYADGDDAYYVAHSAITENGGTMYRKLPYTGGATEVDIRHGQAPFPIWIAFLARVSGIEAVGVAHVAVPLMLIPMTYGIFYLLGKKLLAGKGKYLALFLIFTEILTLFGDYSFYTVEHFMLARSRQGKAALGSIVLPMLLFVLLLLLNALQEKKKITISFWILLYSIILTGCLCSTMGAFLLCLMMAVTGLCAAVGYGNWKVLIPMAAGCAPCVIYMLIYVMN